MYRSFKNFDIVLFISDTQSSSLISDLPNKLDDLVALYDSELSGIFNRHVPIKKRTVTIRPEAPWYSEELKSEKREKRRLERRWRASRSMRDREAYTRQCKVRKDLLSISRSNYYSNLGAENQSNMRSFSQFLANYFIDVMRGSTQSMIPRLLWLMILFYSLVTRSEESVVTLIKSHLWILL